MNNSRERNPGDLYQTPFSITRHLVNSIEMPDKKEIILDPACGHGAILKVLKEEGFKKLHGTDLNHGEPGVDFLRFTGSAPHIITNPPYSLTNDFIEKSYQVAERTFHFFLPLDYLHGLERYRRDLFRGLYSIGVLIRKPMLKAELRDDGKYSTGMQSYAWYSFSAKKKIKKPFIFWIDNSMDVVGSGKKRDIIDDEAQILMELPSN